MLTFCPLGNIPLFCFFVVVSFVLGVWVFVVIRMCVLICCFFSFGGSFVCLLFLLLFFVIIFLRVFRVVVVFWVFVSLFCFLLFVFCFFLCFVFFVFFNVCLLIYSRDGDAQSRVCHCVALITHLHVWLCVKKDISIQWKLLNDEKTRQATITLTYFPRLADIIENTRFR